MIKLVEKKRYTRHNLAQYLDSLGDACKEVACKLCPEVVGNYEDPEEEDTIESLLEDHFWNIEVDDLVLLLNDAIEVID